MGERSISKRARMTQERTRVPRHVVVDGAVDQLEKAGFDVVEAPSDEPLTAGDIMSFLFSGIASGRVDPDKPIKLEDPNLMTPWDVRRVRLEGDELVLDVWGD